jgi:hypothetical protein
MDSTNSSQSASVSQFSDDVLVDSNPEEAALVSTLFVALLRTSNNSIAQGFCVNGGSMLPLLDTNVRHHCLLAFNDVNRAQKWLRGVAKSKVVSFQDGVWINAHFDSISVLTLSELKPCIILVLVSKRQRYSDLLKFSHALDGARSIQFLTRTQFNSFMSFYEVAEQDTTLMRVMAPRKVLLAEHKDVDTLRDSVMQLLGN